MFITHILAAFTLAAALGQAEPVLVSPHTSMAECEDAKRAAVAQIPEGSPIGLACLAIIWSDA